MLNKSLFAVVLLAGLATPAVADARLKLPIPLTGNVQQDLGLTGDPVADVKTAVNKVAVSLLTSIYDKLHKDGTAAIADANRALLVVNQKLADGSVADPAGASCLAAVIPVMQIITNNAVQGSGVAPVVAAGSTPATPVPAPDVETAITAGTVDGPITVFAKLRVMISALQSDSVKKGCAQLQVETGNTGLSGITGLVAGFVGLKTLTPLAPAALTALGL